MSRNSDQIASMPRELEDTYQSRLFYNSYIRDTWEDSSRKLKTIIANIWLYYPTMETIEAVSKANTAVNLLEGMTRAEVNGIPRRFATETIDGKQKQWYTSPVS